MNSIYNTRKNLILVVMALCSLVAAACDDVANDPGLEGNVTATVAYFAGAFDQDSYDAVQEDVHSALTKGGVKYEIDCSGVALGAGGKSVAIKQYKASRIHDGACNAKVDLFMSLPPTPGLSQSSASELQARDTPERPTDADVCLVNSFSVAGVRFVTWIEGGVIHVEGPGCTTTSGTTCSMDTSSPFASCTGDLDEF